jgi:CSLREA domain-containing protein
MGMRRTALLLASTALFVLLTSGVALATGASQIGTTAAPGTTIVVNSKGDGAKTGNCTLREAIGAATPTKRWMGVRRAAPRSGMPSTSL